ncbi:acyl-CoA thioesterase [Shimia biformata]|uniref:acyl-CoA thioesterase n=1 Tax=Shimia biformata TaxID=1294299 RepID=UPI00194F11C9|nr:acyl-CoA thioesterase [Shimia biformata]
MYPFFRLIREIAATRRAPQLGLTDTHESTHRCWPWDIDFAMELNNGRTLTLFDLGRIPLIFRNGAYQATRAQGWMFTMAGVSVRYRRRVRPFEKITMKSRIVCWDDRFIYIEQAMFKKNGDCAHHALYRTAATDKNGIVSVDRINAAIGYSGPSPETPDWIAAWQTAETQRPWPPMQA